MHLQSQLMKVKYFIEFRLILSVTSENYGKQNYFFRMYDKLLKYHVDVKCFSFYVPPQFYMCYIQKMLI
jgi:hypothetical protein